jgi:hypothetical protein
MIFNAKRKLFLSTKWIALIFALFLLQLFLMPLFTVQEVVPNLMLVLIVVTTQNFGLEVALPVAAITSIVQSNFLYDRYLFLSWLLTPFIALVGYPQLSLSRPVLAILHVVLCTAYIELINFFVFSFERGLNSLSDSFWILILSPIFNGLLAYPIIYLQRKVLNLDD